MIAAVFAPTLGVLAGSGLIKGVLALCTSLNLLTTESGKTKFIRATARNIYDDDGNFLRLNMSAQDITKEKEYTNNLIKTDHEKTVLLQEVHHRVRNNLQIIMSFINLEKRFHKVNMKKLLILQKDVLDHLL